MIYKISHHIGLCHSMSVATVSSLTSSSKDGLSPAQKLFGHLVQDILPAHRCSFLPQWQQPVQEATQQTNVTSKSSAAYYNLHSHNLPDIHAVSHVTVQKSSLSTMRHYWVVTKIYPHCRYYVKSTDGRVLVHNRCFLHRRIPNSVPVRLDPHTTSE